MKKHSMLVMFPLALVIAGCSGNLSKGSIIDEKFMKYNFGNEVEEVATYQMPSKVELNLGSDIKEVYQHEFQDQHLIKVTKNDDTIGYFSVLENKYVIPFDSWDSYKVVQITGAPKAVHRVYCGRKNADEEGIKHFKAYDEQGNEFYSGEWDADEDWYLAEEAISRNKREGNEYCRYRFIAGKAVWRGNLPVFAVGIVHSTGRRNFFHQCQQ